MKLDKAIEISTKVINHETPCWMPKALEAQKLGIEALNYIIRLRACSLQHRGTRLPGETPGTSETFSDETLNKVRESPLGRQPKG